MAIFEFAIGMEMDGEKYYRDQAQRNAGNPLEKIFYMLAEDEKRHAEILQNKEAGGDYALAQNETLAGSKSIFQGIGDFKSEIQIVPGQLDLYTAAMEMEKKSIDLYEEFLSKAQDEPSKEIFAYLIGQEKEHYTIMEDLAEMVRHALDWVESAEFGIRKEY